MAKRTYVAKKMFQDAAFFVEIREGKKWQDWLKVGSVPEELHYLMVDGLMRAESVRCPTFEIAKLLAKRMNEQVE